MPNKKLNLINIMNKLEKIEILKSNDFTVGDAIDLIFNVQKEIKNQIEKKMILMEIYWKKYKTLILI